MKTYIWIFLLQTSTINFVHAQVYKCENEDGQLTYQDTPCNLNQTESLLDIEQSYKSGEDKEEGFLISKADLLGTWTDVYPKSEFSSTWTFTYYGLTYRRYSGKVVRASYTLKKDQLVVHHTKSLFNNKPWDEVYKLLKYEDGILSVNSVMNLQWHKLD